MNLANNGFQVHGSDEIGHAILRKRLRRNQVLEFFAKLPSRVVAMEASAGAHHWGRKIGGLDHDIKLIPSAYVKPFVKRQKNDMADAEAICDAASRPTMRFSWASLSSELCELTEAACRRSELALADHVGRPNACEGLKSITGHSQIVLQIKQ